MRHAIFSVLFLFAAIAWSAPVTIVLQDGRDGYAGTEDAYISSTTAGSNYGAFTDLIAKNEMCVAWDAITYEARVAVKFDLSGIPKDAKITKAELCLFGYAIPNASVKLKNAPKLIAKITSAWVEGTITWNTVPAVSGAALATCFNTQVNTWELFDVTSDVKAIVETNGPNNGYLLKFPMHDHGIKYHSSESSTAGNRPKLTITYESSTAVLPGWNIPAAERYTGIITTMQGRRIQTFVIKDLRGIGRATASLSAGVYIVTISTRDRKFNAQSKLVK